MSVLNQIKEIVFDGRKPSYAQVMRAVGEEISKGNTDISVEWGENYLEVYFDHRNKTWYGTSWIKDISGQDIAEELNEIRAEAIKNILGRVA